MLLWIDDAHDVRENMRRDEALLRRAAASPRFEPVLRLFRFTPPGITLGYAQRPERELDLERCRRDGVLWAIRPTGGRAIFHDEEWTYSVTARTEDPELGGTLTQAYARVSRLLLGSLRRLGVAATMGEAPHGTAGRLARGPAPPCFATALRHEILLDGRKLAGSAQRRVAGAYIQQGSLLLGPGHLRLADYLALDARRREATRRALAAASAWAGDALAGRTLDDWAQAIEDAWCGPVRGFRGNAAHAFHPLSGPAAVAGDRAPEAFRAQAEGEPS